MLGRFMCECRLPGLAGNITWLGYHVGCYHESLAHVAKPPYLVLLPRRYHDFIKKGYC
ncbi:hypothetical protein BDW42DRAFT_163384, partial [Aspergillus taichungensis]